MTSYYSMYFSKTHVRSLSFSNKSEALRNSCTCISKRMGTLTEYTCFMKPVIYHLKSALLCFEQAKEVNGASSSGVRATLAVIEPNTFWQDSRFLRCRSDSVMPWQLVAAGWITQRAICSCWSAVSFSSPRPRVRRTKFICTCRMVTVRNWIVQRVIVTDSSRIILKIQSKYQLIFL